MKNTLYILLALLSSGVSVVYAQNIPVDPQLRAGKLSNGFTYYIRHNEQPKKRVELYLVNKVGSVLEDDGQQGLAHFMEHMNFNGTKNFPKNDLVDYLQKAGVRFGADLNAYTSFDETVYQLPLPTDNPLMFENGLKIMRDWAQEATLDPSEIEKERGVVLEEERLGKGANDRMARQYYPMLFNHSRYAERLPIGRDFVLTGFTPEVIKKFHYDWYRPNLQALIVVGDIDVNVAERLIRENFSSLKNPEPERQRTKYTIPLDGKGQFLTVTDKEETDTKLEVLMKHRSKELVSEQDYLLSVKTSLLNQMIENRRYTEFSRDPNPAYSGVSIGISSLINDVDYLSFSITAKEGRLQESFLQTWRVLERIKKYGFTQTELDRAKQNQLRNLLSATNERDKTPSTSYVKEYQNLFLHQEASPGIDWEYQFTKARLKDIGLNDISNMLGEYLQSTNVDVLITAPDKVKSELPDSATVHSWIVKIQRENISPFKEERSDKQLLSKSPLPGKIVRREIIQKLNVTKITLSNGVTVIMKPTDFKNDQILYGAFAPGGTSLYNNDDFTVASNAGGLMSRMGIGTLNPIELSQFMTGKVASSAATLSLRSQTVKASSSSADLETALQLTYLQFTAPRTDSLLFKNTMDNAIAGLSNRYANPVNVYADTMNYVLGDYNYRSAAPTAEKLSKITISRALQIYKERFADASAFTFVFVGNFDQEKILPLIAKYLGSLPSTYKQVRVPDLNLHIPSGVFTKKIYKGTENKAIVRVVFSGDYKYSPLANLQLKALGDILQIKILQQLREAEGEVYSPQVQTIYTKYPSPRFGAYVSFGCDPKNVDHLVGLVKAELQTLKTKGPDADDVVKFKAQYKKTVEVTLRDNNFWLNYLLGQYENNEDPLEVLTTDGTLNKITKASLIDAAQTFLSGKNAITFELLPESLKDKQHETN